MKREWARDWAIRSGLDDEGKIRDALERKLPELVWEDGDSYWDKVRVWGTGEGVKVRVYRYESPGPFALTVTVEADGAGEADRKLAAMRNAVAAALGASA
jgi:hypothetical protein